jgi:hypothetical protein
MTFLSSSFWAQNTVVQDCDNNINRTQVSSKSAQVTGCASTNNLLAPYASNNSQRGIMFDVQGITAITIMCFDANLDAGTSNVVIYTKAGTHVGFEVTPAAWTLVGTAINLVSAGTNLPTYIPVAVNISIAAGATQAFYITRTTVGGPTTAYTNGVAVGNIYASDANLRIREGTGKDYSFGANFTPRKFNGRIYYNIGVLPIELTAFTVSYSNNLNLLKWTTVKEIDSDYFLIEKSSNATNFSELVKIKGAGNSNQSIDYSYKDDFLSNGVTYYRLKTVSYSGKVDISNIIAVDNKTVDKVLIKTLNMLGQTVESGHSGVVFSYYSDGTIIKKVNK